MNLDEKTMEEKIREYRAYKSCSESTLFGICETIDYPMEQSLLCKLSCGFAGGIGGTFDEGTCGALVGALLANGLLVDDEVQIKSNAKQLYNYFKEEYGSVQCGVISKNGEDKSPCVECCVIIAKKLAELIND